MRVEDLFKRLKREYLKIRLLQSTLDTLILLLTINLLAFISGLKYDLKILAGLGVLFFSIRFYYLSKDYSVQIYEKENKQLDELLRTARDNLDRRDEITQALFEDVMERSRKVSSESIIPSDRVFQKLFLVGGLAILTAISGLIAPAIDYNYSGLDNPFSGITGINGEDDIKGNSSEVMREPIDIDTTGRNVNISIEGEGKSLEEGFRSRYEEEDLRFEASNDRLGEDLELAKRYSLAIRNLE